MKKSIVSQVFLFIFMLSMGVFIVAQIRTQVRTRKLGLSDNNQTMLLTGLINANHDMQIEIASLEAQLAEYQDEQRKTVLEGLVNELNWVKIANGAINVSGPGIELRLDGPLTALDLQDLLNELRNAGAEAIALNDQRLTHHSTLTIDGKGQILLNGHPTGRPFRFQAIGDSETMKIAMLRPGGSIDLLKRNYPNLTVQVIQQSTITLGVRRSQAEFKYAQPVE